MQVNAFMLGVIYLRIKGVFWWYLAIVLSLYLHLLFQKYVIVFEVNNREAFYIS